MSRNDNISSQQLRAIKREIDLISQELQLTFFFKYKRHAVNNPTPYRKFAENHRLWHRFNKLCRVRIRLLT